jgi:hypothetical protein
MASQSEQQHDLAFMKNDSEWTSWPLCPLKADGMKVAFLITSDGGKPIIHIGNFYEMVWDHKPLEDFPIKEYPSFEELQQDGWRVD